MHEMLQDLRYGSRTLAKSPGFAIAAVLTLALGIGANTAIFNLLDSAVLRALPVPHPDELVLLTDPEAHGHGYGSEGANRSLLAFWEFQFLRDPSPHSIVTWQDAMSPSLRAASKRKRPRRSVW